MDKINLFCLPFAGGSRHSYNGYIQQSPRGINVVPLELPGRGTRIKETLLSDVHAMTEDVYRQLKGKLHMPYAIYGHSMGTIVGYLLVRKILENNDPSPLALFVSGRGGPSVKYDDPIRHDMSKSDFVQKLRELGGSPPEILEDENLIRFFEPILRSDFKAVETFDYVRTLPMDIPITVMIGISEKTTFEQAQAWQLETSEPVLIRQFPGNHFFIFNYENEILKLIHQSLTAQTLRA